MASSTRISLSEVFKNNESEILKEWIAEQLSSGKQRKDWMPETELRQQSQDFLSLTIASLQTGDTNVVLSPNWAPVREFLAAISRSRAQQGFSPSETATFVFSLKQPVFRVLRSQYEDDPRALIDEVWQATTLLDRIGLHITELYQKSREEIIIRQREELLELSTPVVKLWDGILALPMIGTLDSARTQVVMETLLQKIVETGSDVAIIDITGVPTVDTLVAQHLLKTVTAARLMGADCIISGIRPQIAATIVHLGIDLSNVTTKSSLADAFLLALRKVERAGGAKARSFDPSKLQFSNANMTI